MFVRIIIIIMPGVLAHARARRVGNARTWPSNTGNHHLVLKAMRHLINIVMHIAISVLLVPFQFLSSESLCDHAEKPKFRHNSLKKDLDIAYHGNHTWYLSSFGFADQAIVFIHNPGTLFANC